MVNTHKEHTQIHTLSCYLSQTRSMWQMGVPDDEHHQICVSRWKPSPALFKLRKHSGYISTCVCVWPAVFISAHVYVGWQYRQCLNGPGWVFSVWCVSLCLSPSQQFLSIQVVFIQANNDKIQQFSATSKHIFWFSRVICWCSVFLLLASLSLCPFPLPVDPSASGLSASELGWTYPK